ncbi:MAG: sigma-70 family RNA polymerase sigma factor [Tissierellia bacterium]|nr:sigma-70 family RNA polymerase sigma factor [Tissierellia bacterium]
MDDINHIIQKSLEGDKLYEELLLIKLLPLIFNNIYNYYSLHDNIVDDLVQEGYIVILEALKTFDKNLNVHFLQYIKIKLKFYYKNYFRNTKYERQIGSLDQRIEKYYNDIKYENIFINNNISMEETFENNEEIKELIKNIQKLNIQEQEVLYLFFFQNLSMKKISKLLNTRYRTIVGRKYSAIKKLKKMMINKG